jgi:DNA polymerase elongation subunit (family B)
MTKKEKIEFQLYDWLEDHDEDNDDEDTSNPGNYIIHSFGRCADGKSVYAKITNYTPYFYILLSNRLQNKSQSYLKDFLKKLEDNFKNNKKIYYKYKSTLKEVQLLKLKRAEGFTNDKEYYFARLVFDNADGLKKYRYYLENNDIYIEGEKYNFKLYEANLAPMLRCFHIRDISGCSWVETEYYDKISNDEDKISLCDIEIHIEWQNLVPIKKEYNAPFRICSFDIECNSIDGEFPQAKRPGDYVIQIGATYTYLGESQPYRQYIGCLNTTTELPNIIVESHETESELIEGFINELNNNDCDIITGYNIFFFDEKYIYDRCKNILNIDISYLSKLKNFKCKFNEIKLSSSALGDNLLKFWNTPGRIHIDLMKDIQKTFNLQSYKLDFVASKFIRGDIKSINKLDNNFVELSCDTIQDIFAGDYIHIEIAKGFISDEIGGKYLVEKVDTITKKIIINGTSELLSELNNSNFKINWSQAKDDVGPKDIFRLFKGTPNDRAIIAKYCIKDCKLVNLLINKLEVITKNIEMSNVCYVPLSFLFIRGQGIKLFSLCLKEYRKQKYLFPVIKMPKLYQCLQCKNEYYNAWECTVCQSKKRQEIEVESVTFEGAIVFDPIPKVEYEALATKDYMSLYPASIMHKNMSHETIVEDQLYDNLPNVKYYNAQFKDSDGSIQYRRFAQLDNKLGVIPSILDNLLKERKIFKKKMSQESDPFKYKILDAKQYAIKITANSLYGQLGASTSPICKRDIAACTTSTGREMLILAKKYDEEELPCIINSLKYYYNNENTNDITKLYDLELKDNHNIKLIETIKKFTTSLNNITLQPIVRYGDTDSIFSCYRFRENTKLLNFDDSLYLWKKIVKFAYILIEPFFPPKEKIEFNKLFETYYSSDKIETLKLPNIINLDEVSNNYNPKIIRPLEIRLKIFIKEYMEESYIPWLWVLEELVEKDYTYMFDIKLSQWAEHQLSKINVLCENLYENRKKYLCQPILTEIQNIFENNNYIIPSEDIIKNFTQKFYNNDFQFGKELIFDFNKLYQINKNFLSKTIKDKWVYSNDTIESQRLINNYLKTIIENYNKNNTNDIIYLIKKFIKENNNLDINTFTDLLINNILKNKEMNYIFNETNLDLHTKTFIEKYNKSTGKKSLQQIIEDYIEKDLGLNFNEDKNKHYQNVINFIKTYMRRLDMSTMDKENYIYYWLQPRWIFSEKKDLYISIYEGGEEIIDKRSLEYTIELGKLSGELIKSRLPYPHDCEYEKTFWPFAILTKKKYVGNKYEYDINNYKQDFMGIVLKRRDNAAIVKEICGGIIDYLINHKDPEKAKAYTKQCLQDMFDGKYDIKYFLQSRTIKMKESYKNWTRIAHIYLADKIMKRDPGNTPQSGDRIEFAVIKIDTLNITKQLLQGDIIETPEYIKKNNLSIDYLFYLTNQIMNPALQFLELVDKNSVNIFNEFINKYQIKKIKEKIIKEKIIKEKISKKISKNIEIKKLISSIKKEKLFSIEQYKLTNKIIIL